MVKIIVECDRGEDFGVMVWKNTIDENNVVQSSLAVSRQIGNPAEFPNEREANDELKYWLRMYPEALDRFSFRVESV